MSAIEGLTRAFRAVVIRRPDGPPIRRRASVDDLNRLSREFHKKPRTPESLIKYWQAVWDVDGARAGMTFEVPSCDRTTEEIAKLEHLSIPRKLVYIPPELTTIPDGLTLLAKIFPGVKKYNTEIYSSITHIPGGGWFDIESDPRAPYLDIDEFKAEEEFRKQGFSGQKLPVYIVGSEDSKRMQDNYFDYEAMRWQSFSLLPDSTSNGKVIHVREFDENGAVLIQTHSSRINHYINLGYRSERAKTIILSQTQAA
jgi:hypothetical protein